ncbi:MAG: MBL fold metallo-hydrolase [Victivallales bacterium]|nr:MBL fold metallo-hydrolase [Victivallales bacterium]
MLKIKRVIVGALEVNCFIVRDSDTNDALIIDPGDEADRIIEAVKLVEAKPLGILLTHAHVDHIRGVGAVSAAFNLPVWIHEADRAMYLSPDNAILPWLTAAENLPQPVDTPLQLPNHPYEIIETPGHTPGGVCFYFKEEKLLFSGDTLFQGTYGRTDFPGGSAPTLFHSIRTKLFTLPDDVKVWPGHNESTTIGEEKQTQVF